MIMSFLFEPNFDSPMVKKFGSFEMDLEDAE